MAFNHRCLRCGNNTVSEVADLPQCGICNMETEVVLVTEENVESLPQPTNPPVVEEAPVESQE